MRQRFNDIGNGHPRFPGLLLAVFPAPTFCCIQRGPANGLQGNAACGEVERDIDKALSVSFLFILFLLIFYDWLSF
jgi:hypothetical protein